MATLVKYKCKSFICCLIWHCYLTENDIKGDATQDDLEAGAASLGQTCCNNSEI